MSIYRKNIIQQTNPSRERNFQVDDARALTVAVKEAEIKQLNKKYADFDLEKYWSEVVEGRIVEVAKEGRDTLVITDKFPTSVINKLILKANECGFYAAEFIGNTHISWK